MRIDRVTLTGAGDGVRPEQMAAVTAAFPFVEWGILFSPKYRGEPRYPSAGWVSEFLTLGLPCAAHLCGPAVDEFMHEPPEAYLGFGRVQLNFSLRVKAHLLPHLPGVVGRENQIGRTVIFQMNAANQSLADKDFVEAMLFDSSGGRGVSPAAWPTLDLARRCGYAGGLGPDTLTDQLVHLAEVVGDESIWIDMEGRLRSADDRQFDLDKAKRCLELASKWVA